MPSCSTANTAAKVTTVLISGTLSCKLRNKFFGYFQQRHVELVYASNDDGTHYRLDLYKNENKERSSSSSSPVFSFTMNPIAMTSYIYYVNSSKHPFTFVCSSQQTSMCFSATTKYERDAWLSALDRLQWQCQPDHTHIHACTAASPRTQDRSRSSSTPSDNVNGTAADADGDGDGVGEGEGEGGSSSGGDPHRASISYVISLTQHHTNNDNTYFYNYFSSNLWKERSSTKCANESSCTCHGCQGQKFTILGLLNDEYRCMDVAYEISTI